jgi:hypothetical protein
LPKQILQNELPQKETQTLMTIKNIRFSFILLAVCAFAGTAAAQGPAVGGEAISNLEMSATVQTTVQLNISTSAAPGATVGGSDGAFTIDFGNVNALGIGTPASGVTVSAGTGSALYTSPIVLTPVFTGFTNETASITVEKGVSGDEDIAVEGNSLGSLALLSSEPRVTVSGVASASNSTRYVGFVIASAEAAGPKTATAIYTVTVSLD